MEQKKLYKPIGKELAAAEALVGRVLSDAEDPALREMNALLLKSKGKKLRPAFVLLSGYAANEQGAKKSRDSLIKTAAAFELIHLATLVHDDVMDDNLTRHGLPTINKKHGNAAAIGVGDFLFSKAFVLLADANNPDIIGIASKAIAVVCEGQICQLARRGSTKLTMEEGYSIIEKKTAALFAAACEAGALIARGNTKAATEFGHHFGIAFQLVDDYFDIMGTGKMLGKKPGENLHEGEATIPLLMLLQKMAPGQKKALEKKMFTKKGITAVRRAMRQCAIGKDVAKAVEEELEMAASQLDSSSPCSQSLLVACSLLQERISVR